MWECENCDEQCEEGETFCDDCVWLEDMHDGQPDEMQEWHDFDPDCQKKSQVYPLTMTIYMV